MKRKSLNLFLCVVIVSGLLAGCTSPGQSSTGGLKVLALESFLADIAQNVAGSRAQVGSLIPAGIDPHEYTPTPQDVAKIADTQVLIVNGGGLETWLQRTLQNAGGNPLVIVASQGLTSRSPKPGEPSPSEGGVDPHFWLDPVLAIQYASNIRNGLSKADPGGADVYQKNAADYRGQLKDLDTWIRGQVAQIPVDRRLLVTDHDDLGYFADEYGFKVVGTLIPSFSSDASASAQQVAELVQAIRKTGAPAIFLETGVNPSLANQVAQEAGVKVVTDLYTHSTTTKDGPAPTYIDIIRHDVAAIVGALR